MFYLISCDIPDDPRRSQLAKTLKGFGTRVQYSVFETHLSRTQFEELKRAVARVINSDQDSIRYYAHARCNACTARIQVISELLKRTPELTPLAQVYADIPIVLSHQGPIPLVTIYSEQIDSIFGRGFLEQYQLEKVLIQLEGLVQHAESLAHLGETQFALSLLHALIHRSVIRYRDTFQGHELPRFVFVGTCTKIFTQIAVAAQEAVLIGFDTASVETP